MKNYRIESACVGVIIILIAISLACSSTPTGGTTINQRGEFELTYNAVVSQLITEGASPKSDALFSLANYKYNTISEELIEVDSGFDYNLLSVAYSDDGSKVLYYGNHIDTHANRIWCEYYATGALFSEISGSSKRSPYLSKSKDKVVSISSSTLTVSSFPSLTEIFTDTIQGLIAAQLIGDQDQAIYFSQLYDTLYILDFSDLNNRTITPLVNSLDSSELIVGLFEVDNVADKIIVVTNQWSELQVVDANSFAVEKRISPSNEYSWLCANYDGENIFLGYTNYTTNDPSKRAGGAREESIVDIYNINTNTISTFLDYQASGISEFSPKNAAFSPDKKEIYFTNVEDSVGSSVVGYNIATKEQVFYAKPHYGAGLCLGINYKK